MTINPIYSIYNFISFTYNWPMQHELNKYLCVVEAGSFSGAAKKLHISQPALSIAVKNLEKTYGTQLLMRHGHSFSMTEAGAVVFEHARKIRLAMDNLRCELAEEIKSDRTLKLGMIDSVGDMLFGADSLEKIEGMEVSVANSRALIDMLSSDQLDLIFITSPRLSRHSLFSEMRLGQEKFKLVCAPTVAGDTLKAIKKRRIIPRFLTYDQKSTTFAMISRHLSHLGLGFESNFFSSSPELMRLMALSGRGAALLPDLKVAEDLSSGGLVPIKKVTFYRGISVLTLKGKYMSKTMRELTTAVAGGLN